MSSTAGLVIMFRRVHKETPCQCWLHITGHDNIRSECTKDSKLRRKMGGKRMTLDPSSN